MSEVVISLTTIPPRVKYLKYMINSLKRQTRKPDRVELYLPREYKYRSFTQSELANIPCEFTVVNCDDVGPATKILPALKSHRGRNVTIVYCDDDRVYPINWLERLLNVSGMKPDYAIADECMPIKMPVMHYRGVKKDWRYRFKRGLSLGLYHPHHFNDRYKVRNPDIVEGFGGVLVKPSFFSDRVFDVPSKCWAVDDIWLSANLNLAGTPVHYCDVDRKYKGTPLEIGGQDLGRMEDSLTTSSFDEKTRVILNYEAIDFCINNLGVWANYKSLF
jgi:hypothetical protein